MSYDWRDHNVVSAHTNGNMPLKHARQLVVGKIARVKSAVITRKLYTLWCDVVSRQVVWLYNLKQTEERHRG
jgi:hypothetical protein